MNKWESRGIILVENKTTSKKTVIKMMALPYSRHQDDGATWFAGGAVEPRSATAEYVRTRKIHVYVNKILDEIEDLQEDLKWKR